ncbi:MAG: hypothetical protein JNM63_10850, partial [Spirochaetia bacterium]|nr:hypothetical protein [Spirochaetia bacterium]
MSRLESHLKKSRETCEGLFITGPGKIELKAEPLPGEAFDKKHIVTASLINCRCSSDNKAIQQFTTHARVPKTGEPVAIGHETVQLVLENAPGSGVARGDLILITPGHASKPVDPKTFESDPKNGILTSLGYSYRNLGGLRQYNMVPIRAVSMVEEMGFGKLFNKLNVSLLKKNEWSLATLAHAEPFACCYGTNKNIFTLEKNRFVYNVPPRVPIAYLGGTSRMAMINLTIVASRPARDLPETVYITGSQKKLDELDGFALIRRLRDKGVRVVLIDRQDPEISKKLTAFGKPKIIWTNYASQEQYDQAVAALAPGGNLNNYAGASDPAIGFAMKIAPAIRGDDASENPKKEFDRLHHPLGNTDFRRRFGLRKGGLTGLFNFIDDKAFGKFLESRSATGRFLFQKGDAGTRPFNYLKALPAKSRVHLHGASEGSIGVLRMIFPKLVFVETPEMLDDVLIAGNGEAAASAYALVEPKLARGAAVSFVDGDTEIFIHSRFSHYTSRHQICGSNVPWYMT